MKLHERDTTHRPDLESLPEVKAQRPPPVGYCMGSAFYKYEGTDCYQWFANRSAGFWSPYGEVLTGLEKQA